MGISFCRFVVINQRIEQIEKKLHEKGLNKVITIHPEGGLECTKCQRNPSNSCWVISVWTKVVDWQTNLVLPESQLPAWIKMSVCVSKCTRVVLVFFNYIYLDLQILYLKEDGHGSNDASFLDGSAEAVKVIWIVKVDLHLGWETEHKQLEEWTRGMNSSVINHMDTVLRSWWKAVLRGIKEGVFITPINLQ